MTGQDENREGPAGLQSVNSHLRREIEERQRTEAIVRLQRDLALTLSGKVGLHEALRMCVKTGISMSGLDCGGVYLVDPTSGNLDLAYHQGLSPEFIQRVAHYEADELNTYIIMAGRPLYADMQDLPGILDEVGMKEGLRSAAIIPVIHQDQVIAAINVASHHYEEVPATARAALETLAAQVGSAIARVQAEEDLRRAKEDLEIRVAERTAQLQQAKELLEEELRVRHATEQSLRQSEAKYRTLVEQIPAITYTYSLNGGIDLTYISPQIETLLGFSAEEWQKDGLGTWKRQLHPDDRERAQAEIAHSFASGGPFAIEYRLLAKSGRVVWFRDEARVVYDPDGQFRFLQGVALDITKRKQAEEALRATSHTLETLIKASPLAIITLDPDFKISLWNPGAERMFGWQASEVLGGYLPFVPDNQRNEEEARLKVEMAGKEQSALELKRIRKDGSIIDVHLWTASLLDANGKIIGNMGILADITERKRAQEALRESEERFRAFMDNSPAIAWAKDEAGRYAYLSKTLEKRFGVRLADWQGKTDFELWPQEIAQEFRENDLAVLKEGQAIDIIEQTRCPDGRLCYWWNFKFPFSDTAGLRYVGGIGVDITERKRAELALKESQQQLRRLSSQLLSIQEKERRRLSRELHDEVGQALTVLKIQLVAIEDKLTLNQHPLKANCEQMLSYIDTVIENVRRLAWDLSPSSLDDLGLSTALRSLVEEICRNHNLQSSVEIGKIDHLFSPEAQINIYRIFQESLTNVIKHAKASQVSVKISKENSQVSFMIRDDGRGFNIKQAMSRKSAKRSLGFTTIYERVLMARGSLQIAGRRGRGTTITFAIPIIDRAGRAQ